MKWKYQTNKISWYRQEKQDNPNQSERLDDSLIHSLPH